MAERIRLTDWAATPLGPVAGWPQPLRTAVDLVLDATEPASVSWGPELVYIYNDALAEMIGGKHPGALGRPTREVYPEVWDAIGPRLAGVMAGEGAVRGTDEHLPLKRDGHVEDAWFSFSYTPVRRQDGSVGGVLALATETTGRVLAQRARHDAERRERDGEARFRAFVTASSDVVYRMNPDWSEMQALEGRDFLAATPRPYRTWVDRFVYPEDRPRVLAVIQRALETEEPLEFEHRIRRVDGSTGWVVSRAVPIRDADGRIVEWIGAARDVTDRKRADAALQESETRLRHMAEASPAIFWIADPDGGHVYTSRQWENYTGVRADGTTAAEMAERFIHPDDAPTVLARFAEAARSGTFEVEHRLRSKTGEYRWFIARARPERDPESGQILRWFGASTDIHDLRTAEEGLNETARQLHVAEQRQRVALDAAGLGIFEWHLRADQPISENERMYEIFGRDRDAGPITYEELMRDVLHPDDRKGLERAVADAERTGLFRATCRITRASDNALRWIEYAGRLVHDGDGAPERLICAVADITDRIEAADRLRQSRERLRSAVEVARLGLWDWNLQTGDIDWSRMHYQMLGYSPGEVTPSYDVWGARVHPDDRGPTEAAILQALEGGDDYEREYRVVHPDGAVRWLHARGRVLRDEAGAPQSMAGAMIDVTERRELEERQRVLIAELQHRTRNLLALVHSIARETMTTSGSVAEFRERFEQRLQALARVQGLLSRSGDRQVTLDELIRMELDALGPDADTDRVSVTGPPVILRPSIVQTMALAIHELATNARKHGALGVSGGRLAITWAIVPDDGGEPDLALDWTETGVTIMMADGPPPRGYGRELIERALPYSLRARTRFDLGPDGARCRIELPLTRRQARNPG